jgi:hypothetical protein
MRYGLGALLIVGFVGVSGVHVASAQDSELAEDFFTKEVWPIFQESCFKCHGPEKQKGDLRLDFPEAIRRGGEFGDTVIPGDAAGSTLIELVSLPVDDEDVMPGKGEHLTDEQIATLTTWIDGGTPYGDWTPEFAFLSMGISLGGDDDSVEGRLAALAASVDPASQEAVDALLETGAVAGPLSQDNALLQVGFHLLGDTVTDDTLAALEPVKDQVTWLNLAGTSITDDGLAQLAALPNLTRLHLEKTSIGDAGLAHLAGMKQLEYLNLYATQVSDAGVDQLSGLVGLQKLYLWQSNVTDDGADKLRAAIPELDINMGVEAIPETPAAEETADAGGENLLARFFDEGSCCAKANEGGEVCGHDCCKEAAEANSVCSKCNADGAAKFEVTKQFDADSCCGKANAENKDCDHPCCAEALAKNEVCTKCNPGAKG